MDFKESEPFYHTAAWKRVRELAIQRDGGMCQECMRKLRAGYGYRPRRAYVVHHVVPLKERPDLALDLDNLESLCAACHNAEHPEKGQRVPDQAAPRPRVIKV